MLWCGVFLVSCPVLAGYQWTAALSPAFTAATLLTFSGIPLLESKSDARHGHKPEYRQYKAFDSHPALANVAGWCKEGVSD